MTALETWLKQATRHLSMDSIAQVRSEIQEHYQSALEAAINGGASVKDEEQIAVAALGDAKLANREYRKVLLTAAEASMLRDGKREARFVFSRRRLQPALLAISLVALLAAIGTFLNGFTDVACAFLVVAMGTAFLHSAETAHLAMAQAFVSLKRFQPGSHS
jgi:hypothetical protein